MDETLILVAFGCLAGCWAALGVIGWAMVRRSAKDDRAE